MKTLLFTLEYPPFNGGVANFYGNLAKYWPLGDKFIVLDNRREELMSKRPLSWLKAIDILENQLSLEKPDYVLVGQILPLGTVAWIVSYLHRFRYGVFLHGLDFSSALKSPRKRFLTRQILRRADKVICANSFVLGKLAELWPELSKKAILVNPGIETAAPLPDFDYQDRIEERYGLEGKTVLFSLGRLVARKGVDRTLQALALIPAAARQRFLYFIAGTGPKEDYLKGLVGPEIADQVVFLGALKDSEKWTWLRRADIFIMPARDIAGDFEGFGIVYLEAALCGKPVIAGASGGVRDAVIDGQTGILVDPESPEEIAAAILKLAGDQELRVRLGRQGKERAVNDFNWEKQVEKLAAAL